MRPLILFLLLAAPAAAQDALTAEEFEDLVTGRTLTYGAAGETPYGVEHYHPNRRVTWAFLPDTRCIEGEWYPEGPPDDTAICFVYVDEPGTHCWQMFREGDGLRAVNLDDGGSMLYELAEQEGGLVCNGVGV
jgi:hypothetical protein